MIGCTAIRWRNDDQIVALANFEGIRIWDPFSGRVLRQKNIPVRWRITDLAWNAKGSSLAVSSADGRLLVVRADTLEEICSLAGHSGEVRCVDWSGDGHRIASAGSGGTVRVWDAATGDPLLTLEHPEKLGFLGVAWSPDSRRLAAGDSQGNVFIWGSAQIQPLPSSASVLATGVISRALQP